MIYSQQVIADGASNYWRLNESSGLVAVDIIGGKNGTISGGVTLGQTGAVTEDKSMLFDGTTGKILTAASVTLTAQVTVEGWIRSTMNPAYQTLLSNRQVTSAAGDLFIGVDGTGRPVVIGFASGAATGARVVTDGVWHHVVYIANGSTLAVYVDGVLDLTPSFIRGTTFAGVTGIGIDPQTSGSFWLGSLDEVAIYPFALTGAQISNHYSLRNSTSVGVVPLISPGPVTPLIQNVVYALPTAKCQLLSEVVCQTSSNLTGPFADLTGSNVESGKLTQGGFIRCATGNTNIVVKKHTVQKAAESKYASTVKYDGASNYWRLGETSGTTAVDIIGGKNGVISGGVTLNQTGATNDGDGSMTFNGTTGRIATTAPVRLVPPYSFEVWFNTTKLGGFQDIFSTLAPPKPEDGILIQLNSVNLRIFVGYAGGTSDDLNYGANINTSPGGVWHHLVVIVTSNDVFAYCDGSQISLSLHPTRVIVGSTAHILEIAHDGQYSSGDVTGSLDEVAIYPYALTGAQVQNHYKLSAYSTSKYSALVVADGASNYWKLNELSGTSAIDMIGGKNGTISGGVSLGQAGAIDKSMTFDGITGTVDSGVVTVTLPLVCSIEGWVKPNLINTYHSMFSTRFAPNGFLVGVVDVAGAGHATCYSDNSTPASVVTTISVPLGVWTHIVFTRTGTSVSLYVNGVASTFAQTHVAASIRWVMSDLGNGNSFNGSVDDVAIYPYALTPSQVLAHYNAR